MKEAQPTKALPPSKKIKSMQDTKKTPYIRPRTVSGDIRPIWRDGQQVVYPTLLLTGKWFLEAGFTPDCAVDIKVGKNKLTITKRKEVQHD